MFASKLWAIGYWLFATDYRLSTLMTASRRLAYSQQPIANSLLLHHHSTIHHDHLAGEKRRIVGGQEERRSGDILWSAPASQRCHIYDLLAEFGVRLLPKRGL